MIDWLLLVLVLFVGSQMAKLSIRKRTYITVLMSTIFIVLVGSLFILNNSAVAEVTTSIARYLDDFGIGNPFAWRVKSSEFRNEIEGCYYLMLLGVVVLLLTASAFKHADLDKVREKQAETITQVTALVILIAFFWFLFYLESSLSSGVAPKKIRHFYNSQGLLMLWELIWLLMAKEAAKTIRVLFEKKTN